jgi:hypothetical protein
MNHAARARIFSANDHGPDREPNNHSVFVWCNWRNDLPLISTFEHLFFRKEQQERRKYQQGNARYNQATLQVTGSLLNQTDCVRSDKSTEICDRGN